MYDPEVGRFHISWNVVKEAGFLLFSFFQNKPSHPPAVLVDATLCGSDVFLTSVNLECQQRPSGKPESSMWGAFAAARKVVDVDPRVSQSFYPSLQ